MMPDLKVIIRFTLVGGGCAIINILLITWMTSMGIGYIWATIIAYAPLSVLGYYLHSKITYVEPISFLRYVWYTFTMTWNFPGWVLLLYFLHDLSGFSIFWSAVIATLLMYVGNLLVTMFVIKGGLPEKLPARNK